MRKNRKTLILTIIAVLLIPAGIWTGLYFAGKVPAPGKPAQSLFNMSDRIATLKVEREFAGDGYEFEFEGRKLSPEDFAEEIHRRSKDLPSLYRWLDVTNWTGLIWVIFGLFAQVTFMFRLLIQWRASERAKASVVPPAFWWFSLLGSSMLLIYFIWRKEPVGFLGQCTGWFIYVRNLWFIYGNGVHGGKKD